MTTATSVYLAAPYAEKENMDAYAKVVEAANFKITHKWWRVEETGKTSAKYALDDVDGVIRADYLIVFNSAISEGKSFEQGVAHCYRIPIIGIGQPGQHYPDGKTYGNVFHALNDYYWVDNLAEAITKVKELDLEYHV